MKIFPLTVVLTSSLVWWVPQLEAQSARQLTRKIVPPTTNAPPARPAPPVAAARPAAPSQTVVVPARRPVDPEKARKEKEELVKRTVAFQKKRAEEGSPSAQYELGLRYLTGDGVEKNEAQGLKWLNDSAKSGYAPAKAKLEQLDGAKK